MLNTDQRTDRYHAQNGTDRLTHRQSRRIKHKAGHQTLAAKAVRQANAADRAADRAKRATLRTPRISR